MADVCAEWWRKVVTEAWGKHHPAQADPSCTIPLFMHGDEGSGHKKKAVMILSIVSPLSKGTALDTRFPCVIMPAKLMCAQTRKEMQEFMAAGFNKAWAKRVKGYRAVFAGTRGDWKFHIQFYPEEGVSYTSEHVCLGCNAATTKEAQYIKHGWGDACPPNSS